MDFKQLEAFVYVVEKKSFSKAAELLFLTQPTISTHINSLEKELDTELIIRTTKNIHPSQAGEKLYEYARQMLDLRNQALQEFTGRNDDHEVGIRLAASTIPSQYILPDVLTSFSTIHPKSSFYVLQGDSKSVLEKIMNQTVEFGLLGTIEENDKCHYEPFFKDRLVMVTPNTPRYKEIKDKRYALEALLEEPIIMRETGSGTRKEAEKFFDKIHFDVDRLKIVAQMNEQEAIKRAVSKGMGISIMSQKAAEDFVEANKVLVFDLGEETVYRDLYIAYPKNRRLSIPTMRFIKYIKSYYKKM